MEIKVFTYDYVSDLLRNVKNREQYDPYYSDRFLFEERFPKGKSGITLPDDFELLIPEKGKSFDLENSIAIFENLQILNPARASDSRLWTYLSHVTFWDYMRIRWPAEKSSEETGPKRRILERYLLAGSTLETLTRNGISRLWWYAYLTVDEKREDKYELTRVLLERAEIAVGLLERAMGSNPKVRNGILEFLKINDEVRRSEDKTREFYKMVNLAGGVSNLPVLNSEELLSFFDDIVNKAM